MNMILTPRASLTVDLRVSRYDRLSALLVAAVAVFGILVFLLFLNWLTASFDRLMESRLIHEGVVANADRDQNPYDWLVPMQTEFPETQQAELASALQTVNEAVSRIAIQLGDADNQQVTGIDGRQGGPTGIRGDEFKQEDVVPEAARWQVVIAAADQAEYWKILDHFEITLGIVSELSNKIEYVSELTAERPGVTQGVRRDEPRLFFVNSRNRLRRWDQGKAEDSGVELENTLVGHFYSSELQDTLRNLEAEVFKAEGKQLGEVLRTGFRVRATGDGYEYQVETIQYRALPDGD